MTRWAEIKANSFLLAYARYYVVRMKGNQKIFSRSREERVKGYKKLLKKQQEHYKPPKDIVKSIVEAMEAQGFEVTQKEVTAYMMSSYAVFDREFYKKHRKG